MTAEVQLDLLTNVAPPAYPDGIPRNVCDLFETLALSVHKTGFARFSADAVLHRIRWHHQVDRGDRDFKCNNNWTAPLARWFISRHPELATFFELRESPHRGEH